MIALAYKKEENLSSKRTVFPIGPLLLCIVLAAFYTQTAHFVVIGPAIPIINSLGLVGFIAYFLLLRK